MTVAGAVEEEAEDADAAEAVVEDEGFDEVDERSRGVSVDEVDEDVEESCGVGC